MLLAPLSQRLALVFCDFFNVSLCGPWLPARLQASRSLSPLLGPVP